MTTISEQLDISAAALPLIKQLPYRYAPVQMIRLWQREANAITLLRQGGYIEPAVCDRARGKLLDRIVTWSAK